VGATIRITEGRPTVAAGGSEWPFTVDLRNGTASVEIDGQAWHVRPQRWIEKRRLARFAHYGEEFVRGQLWTMCVEPAEARRSGTEAEALLAVAAWLSGGGLVQQALPLDSALLTRVTVAACRELGVAPHALDDLAPYEVESLWRGGRESAEVTRQPVDEPYQPSEGASEFTHRILIVPDDAGALPPEGETLEDIGASRFVSRGSSHDDKSTIAGHEPPITNHESPIANEPWLPASAGRMDPPLASVAPEDPAIVQTRDVRFMNRASVGNPESITNSEPPIANPAPPATDGERSITNHESRITNAGAASWRRGSPERGARSVQVRAGDSENGVRRPRSAGGNLPRSRFRVVSGVLPATTAIPMAASISDADAPRANGERSAPSGLACSFRAWRAGERGCSGPEAGDPFSANARTCCC
jgi:hypothetical protein